MFIVIQLLTALFILLSLSLIVTVPVALATPGKWESLKDSFYKSVTLWTTFIFLITVANAIVQYK